MKRPMQSLHMKDMIVIIVSSLHLRKSVNVGELFCPFSLAIFKLEVCCCNVTLFCPQGY